MFQECNCYISCVGIVEFVMTSEEREAFNKKIDAELSKLVAETAKLVAETSRINNENRYYPLVVGSGATLALIAIVKLFL